MRAFIITYSSVAFALLLVLGPIFNVLSDWQIDVPTPYDHPVRVAGTLLGEAPGILLALAALGYALYDAAQRHAPRWFTALLIWPVIPLLASPLMFAGALSYAGLWFAPLALLPFAPFLYGLVAASSGLRPAAPGPASGRFLPFVGVLALVTVALGAVLIVPPPQSQVGPVPFSPPALQVIPPQANADCAKGIYPQLTLVNIGTQTITWYARSSDTNVSFTPASGTLAPNSTMFVALEGATSARQVNIQFTPSIGSGFTAEFICQ